MKRTFLILPALCFGLLVGCGESDRRTAQSDGYQETEGLNEANTDESLGGEGSFDVETERTAAAGLEEETQEFLTEAASSSMMEVQLADLAQEKAQSQEVKDFAQMLETDHQQANENLKNIAQQKNVNLPQDLKEDHQDKVEKLQEKSGNEFDKEYMSMMVEQHEKDIEKFESKQKEVQDQEVKQWVDNTLTSLRQHYEQAQQLKGKVDNTNQ